MNHLIISRRALFGLLVLLVALLGSSPTLHNSFAQDDVPLVVRDDRGHDPTTWSRYLGESYWPPPGRADLYRPLTSLLIGVEWVTGGGTPLAFKLIQLTLYAAASVAVFALALRLLPPVAALATALLFAVHPVHVEAVALAVNQAEVVVGLLSALSLAWYLDRRRRGMLSHRDHAGLAGITLIAAHFKESGVMIPALLFAAEVFLIEQPRWRERWRKLSPLFVWQTLAVVLTLALRSRIPLSNASGSFVAEAFDGMPIAGRALTMLTVVPEWLRLLLWPATLAADYSPQRIMPVEHWGAAPALGLAILLLVGLLAWRIRRRVPVLSFGVAWTAITLFPVSNVILPTGIALAERTLFSPSIGAMLAVGAVLTELGRDHAAQRRRWLIPALTGSLAFVCLLGTLRSRSRHTIWRDNFRMWPQTVIDVPNSHRAWVALAALFDARGEQAKAVAAFSQAVKLWGNSSATLYRLAEWQREAGRCDQAIPNYRRGLELSEYVRMRTGLLLCLMQTGGYAEARTVALEGIRAGVLPNVFRAWVRTADYALRTDAPPGTVTFRPITQADSLPEIAPPGR